MSFWKWDAPTKLGTFEAGPLKDGALRDGIENMAKGDSPPVAIVKAITTGGTMNKFAGFSKLNWLGIAMMILPAFAEPVQAAIAAHPAMASGVAGALVTILRTFFTSQPVTLNPAGTGQ